ncbi:hypothetical protein ANN_00113 [Periplaneta americana]|uniref:Uncharacterized protein n=1 Tax=Periplaneta americana TaxID=6978 RepID=A0ABQ8TQ22_PERAM|nr:hypothetical protein ANN_00113 [Periplaneta americana]
MAWGKEGRGKVGSSNNIEELKEELKLRERELRETQAELEKAERRIGKELPGSAGKLRQELEAGREMRRQLEESKEEALRALREELQAKGEELKKMADELQAERQKTAGTTDVTLFMATVTTTDITVVMDIVTTTHIIVVRVNGRRSTELRLRSGPTCSRRTAKAGLSYTGQHSWDTHRVQLLLDAGSQVNAVDHDGRTPLWLAAREDHQDACRALLAAGVQLDVKERLSGCTALHEAAYRGHLTVCELLLAAGARPNEPDAHQWTALHCAACNGRAPVVQLLLQHGAERGRGIRRDVRPWTWRVGGGAQQWRPCCRAEHAQACQHDCNTIISQ